MSDAFRCFSYNAISMPIGKHLLQTWTISISASATFKTCSNMSAWLSSKERSPIPSCEENRLQKRLENGIRDPSQEDKQKLLTKTTGDQGHLNGC